ncbi:methyl-accepting chemotaxis protein [Rhizobium sp. TRM95111]|uniref:methyl-accepting chemotaxis protein n=1 Tax=Rhizobium alarense TaxID=2846851 RepID=UPI001F2ACB9D|nr:methyl-accepting chemotaxis protein [Rhizobium alarense]MCF3642876.1 methyl-accepting chemotaxis protein [Rhizobium alarense]
MFSLLKRQAVDRRADPVPQVTPIRPAGDRFAAETNIDVDVVETQPGPPSYEASRVLRTNSRLDGLPADAWTFSGRPARLVLAYVSPHVDFAAVCGRIRQACGGLPLLATTTAGELCNLGEEMRNQPLYCPADGPWDNVVLQIFGPDVIDAVSIQAVPLANEDIRGGRPNKPRAQRVAQLVDELSRIQVPFDIRCEDTIALAVIDGLSASENYFMEAIYESGRFPCLFVGGSAGGKLDFANTYVFDGERILENHAVIAFVKVARGSRYAVLKSQNFVATGKSLVVIEARPEKRQVTAAVDVESVEIVPIVEAMCALMGCRPEELKAKLEGHAFALRMNGELYVRSVADIDHRNGVVSFYCDVNPGDELHLVRATDFAEQTRRDMERFFRDKPQPVAAILNDCILRRLGNGRALRQLDQLWGGIATAGFSTFGELFGINVNQTLTAVVFFKVEAGETFHDPYVDEFPIHYARFARYFTQSELKRQQLVNDMRKKVIGRLTGFIDQTLGFTGQIDQVIGQTDHIRNSVDGMRTDMEGRIAAVSVNDQQGLLEEEFRKVASMTQRLNDIVGVIDKITMQTNLLSLNATIEAARAGEAGRAFAIVANEVRNLATSTKETLDKSRESLAQVEASIGILGNHIQLSERKLVGAQDGYGQILEQLGTLFDSFKKISEVMDQAGQMSQRQKAMMSHVDHDLARLKRIEG